MVVLVTVVIVVLFFVVVFVVASGGFWQWLAMVVFSLLHDGTRVFGWLLRFFVRRVLGEGAWES